MVCVSVSVSVCGCVWRVCIATVKVSSSALARVKHKQPLAMCTQVRITGSSYLVGSLVCHWWSTLESPWWAAIMSCRRDNEYKIPGRKFCLWHLTQLGLFFCINENLVRVTKCLGVKTVWKLSFLIPTWYDCRCEALHRCAENKHKTEKSEFPRTSFFFSTYYRSHQAAAWLSFCFFPCIFISQLKILKK